MTSRGGDALAGGLSVLALVVVLAAIAGILVFAVIVAWRITAKTGHPGVLGLLYFLPIANVFLLLFLAFGEWPLEREAKRLRRELAEAKAARQRLPETGASGG